MTVEAPDVLAGDTGRLAHTNSRASTGADEEPRSAGQLTVGLLWLLSLPRWAKIAAAVVALVGVAVAVGIPLASLTPFVALGGCLGMHLLMGHGGHGGTDGRHEGH